MGFRLFIWPKYLARWRGGSAKLSQREGAILARLSSRRPVSLDDLTDSLYGHDEDGGPLDAVRVVRVMVCRLRKHLADAPVTIGRCVHGYYQLIDSQIDTIADNIVAGEDHD